MEINQEIIDITEAIKRVIPVERIYLFGSHAYGAPHKDSDYDFFIVIPDDSMSRLDAVKKVHKAIILKDTPVDILADYKSKFDYRKDYNTLERKIFNEGVVLYEQA